MIQNIVFPWLEAAPVEWLPEVVPPFAEVVPTFAMGVLEGAGVLPPVGVEVAVLLGVGVGLEGFEPVGMGGLVSEKLAEVTG